MSLLLAGFVKHVDLITNAEGRDKLCKVLQYICRLLAAFYSDSSEYKTLIYSTLFRKFLATKKHFAKLVNFFEFSRASMSFS